MKRLLIIAALLSVSGTASAQGIVPLFSHDLIGIPDKEGVMLTVGLAPGEASPVHRHNANVFVYVLEGTIVMQVKGAPPVTLSPGQTFYEAPDDIHVVGRNASNTMPAKFLVFFVKDKGKPAVVPVR